MVDLGSLAAERASTLTGDVARAPLRARTSWMLFDWATQPHYTLVQTFLFAPYFANAIVENSACGNAHRARQREGCVRTGALGLRSIGRRALDRDPQSVPWRSR